MFPIELEGNLLIGQIYSGQEQFNDKFKSVTVHVKVYHTSSLALIDTRPHMFTWNLE